MFGGEEFEVALEGVFLGGLEDALDVAGCVERGQVVAAFLRVFLRGVLGEAGFVVLLDGALAGCFGAFALLAGLTGLAFGGPRDKGGRLGEEQDGSTEGEGDQDGISDGRGLGLGVPGVHGLLLWVLGGVRLCMRSLQNPGQCLWVLLIDSPLRRIVDDIPANCSPFVLVPNDALIVVPLPQPTIESGPPSLFDRANVSIIRPASFKITVPSTTSPNKHFLFCVHMVTKYAPGRE